MTWHCSSLLFLKLLLEASYSHLLLFVLACNINTLINADFFNLWKLISLAVRSWKCRRAEVWRRRASTSGWMGSTSVAEGFLWKVLDCTEESRSTQMVYCTVLCCAACVSQETGRRQRGIITPWLLPHAGVCTLNARAFICNNTFAHMQLPCALYGRVCMN